MQNQEIPLIFYIFVTTKYLRVKKNPAHEFKFSRMCQKGICLWNLTDVDISWFTVSRVQLYYDEHSILFQNSSYYWGFAALVAYFVNHPLYTPPSFGNLQVYGGLALFLVRSSIKLVLVLKRKLIVNAEKLETLK